MNIQEFSMDFFSLAGKKAIVTGGNTGLGQAFSVAMAKAGADVLIPSILPEEALTRELIEAEGVRAEFLQVDLTENGEPRRVIELCLELFGGLDILINNAGMMHLAPVLEFDRSRWDPMIAVDLNVPFELMYESAQVMVPQGSGKIINVCSMFSYLGGQGSPAYAATKHAIVGLTKTYADELGQYNVQVNGVAPGYYATDLTTVTRSDPEKNQRVLDHIPANRWGETQDLMGAAVFLASRASDYVNGHILAVDGGYLVR